MITDKQKEIAAKNIKQYRKILGYNQTQFAKELGYGKSTIGDWENGNIPNDIARLEDIAEQLNMSIEELLNEEKEYEIPEEYRQIASEMFEKLFIDLVLIPDSVKEQNMMIEELYKKHLNIIKIEEQIDFGKKIDDTINLIELYEKYCDKNITCVINSLKLYLYLNIFSKPYLEEDCDNLDIFDIDLKVITKIEHQIKKKKINDKKRKNIRIANEFIIKKQRKIFEKIKYLKKDKEHNELADIYLALLYMMNVINRENTPKQNKKMGEELFLIAVETENKFININIPGEPEV